MNVLYIFGRGVRVEHFVDNFNFFRSNTRKFRVA